jgi:hypothetical protein
MADVLKPKPGTPRVALPKIPPWKPQTASKEAAKAQAVPLQQADWTDSTIQQMLLSAHVGARYVPSPLSHYSTPATLLNTS